MKSILFPIILYCKSQEKPYLNTYAHLSLEILYCHLYPWPPGVQSSFLLSLCVDIGVYSYGIEEGVCEIVLENYQARYAL